jgi:hypothetical protein
VEKVQTLLIASERHRDLFKGFHDEIIKALEDALLHMDELDEDTLKAAALGEGDLTKLGPKLGLEKLDQAVYREVTTCAATYTVLGITLGTIRQLEAERVKAGRVSLFD